MASTLWRLQGVQTVGGGDLELGELRLWGESAALDVGALFRASHAPISGTLENLRDGADATTCRWAASDVASPGFYVEWETATAVDAWCVRFSAPQPALAIGAYTLALQQNGVWQVAENGWVPYVSGPSPARASRPVYGIPVGWSQPTGPVAETWGLGQVAVSADGQTVVVAGYGSSAAKVNISRDGGITWSQPAGPVADTAGFFATAVSADGQTVVVAGYGSSAAKVSISRDNGLTWSQPTDPVVGTTGFSAAAVSADGQTVAVASRGSSAAKVSISRDNGLTWSQPTGPVADTGGFFSAAVSADGQTVVVAGYGSSAAKVSISRDSGLTWSQPAGPVVDTWGFFGAAVSADGQTVVVAATGSSAAKVSISRDNGLTWSQPVGPVADTQGFLGAAISADAQTVVVAATGSRAAKVSISRDGGLTWSQPTDPVAGIWGFAPSAVSADGQIMVLAGYGSSAAKVSIGILRDPTYVDAPTQTHTAGLERAVTGVSPFDQGYIGFTTLAATASDREFGGDGTIYGTVAIKADPTNTQVKRRVRLRRSRDGLHARETWSNAQGEYRFEGINRQYEYDVEAWDHTGNMRSVLANNVTPEKMA